jgi:hypothetical protein
LKASTSGPPEDGPRIVPLADGQVTLLPLQQLDAEQLSLQIEVSRLRQEATSLGSEAGNALEEAGVMLLEHPERWNISAVRPELVSACENLRQQVRAVEATLLGLETREHHGVGGIFGRVGEGLERQKGASEKTRFQSLLRPQLMQLVTDAPSETFSEADALRARARSLQDQAHDFARRANDQERLYDDRTAEIKTRYEASKQMGFDALLIAAQMQTDGLTPIQSPLVVKRGENAFYSAAVTLARHKTKTRIVGGSQGFSFPIGHTGIRYRVGSFHGQPISQDYLAKIDTGTLVVTNQRVAFVGSAKSVAFPLAKVLHVEVYTNGLGIFKEGKENADLFLFSDAKRFLMYLNYLLDRNQA